MLPRLLAALAILIVAPPLAWPQGGSTVPVAVVDSAKLHTVPASSPIAALVGKVPGGRVIATTNAPGASPSLRLRGAMASPEGDPLIVLDGAVSPLSLSDISADDVERIEIIGGAAGGAAYGIRGANGVVLITTRRAQSSPFLIARADVGQTSLPRRLPRSLSHYYQLDAGGNFVMNGTVRVPEPDGIQDNPYPVTYDMANAILRNRTIFSSYVAGARPYWNGRTRVTASAGDEHDNGVLVYLSGYSRATGRIAADHALTSRLDLSLSAFGAYVTDANPGADDITESPFMLLSLNEPNLSPDSVTMRNPNYTLGHTQVDRRRHRSGWSMAGEFRPQSWLWLRASSSIDRAREDTRQVFHPVPGEFSLGSRRTANGTQRAAMSEASIGVRRAFADDRVRANARFAFSDEARRTSGDTALTSDLSPPGAGNTSGFWSHRRNKSYVGGVGVEIGGHVALDALLRKDQGPWLVDSRRGMLFHRLAGAYTLGSSRLRAALGTASPPIERTIASAPLILCPIFDPCGGPLRTPYARELELGVEHRFRDRVHAGYTFARQRTTDALFLRPFAGPSGFSAALSNVGTTVAVTHELSSGARLVTTSTLAWDVSVVAHRTRVMMKAPSSPRFLVIADGQILFAIQDGEYLGAMYGTKPIRTQAQLEETLRAGQLTGTAADYVRNVEGYYVRAADLHTVNETPLRAFRCVGPSANPCSLADPYDKIGDANPDVDLGLNTTVRWKGVSLYATLTAVSGGNVYNSARQTSFYTDRDPVFDQSGKPAAERRSTSYYRFFASGPNEFFVENGSFLKLSELAVDWTVPLRYAPRVGLVGRNLFTTSRYGGYDPDAAAGGLTMFPYRVDGSGHPAYRTFGIRVQIGDRRY